VSGGIARPGAGLLQLKRGIYLAGASPIGGGGDLGGVRTRLLDLAGSELIVNGLFPSDITGWTDASSAGGAISYNSGKLRTTNTTGTARARQTYSSAVVGQRYFFFAQNVAGTVNGTVSVGSTTPGSTDYLSTNTNASIAARAGVKELTATTTSINIQLSTGTAGNDDWDNISLRQLIPTVFSVGRVFTHDFSAVPDGPMGVSPDGLLWKNMSPANASHVYTLVSSGRVTMAASGSTTSAGYPFWKFGNGKVTGIKCDLAWNGTGAACAMVSLEPSGSQPTVTDIITNSVHIVFTDTKVDISTYVAGVLTTETVNYGAACATDGTNYPNVGWSLSGSTLTIYLPDGTSIQRTDSKFSQVYGSVGIPEPFYAAGVTGTVSYGKVSMTLG
jgi:hypothetical protein